MNVTPLDFVAICGYFALMAIFGYLTRRTKTFAEFAVGSHSVPRFMVFASLAATIVGPGFSVGFTSKGWASGYLFFYLALAYGAQVVVTGLLLAPRLSEHRDCHSLGDVMRKKYGPATQFLTGIVSVGLCIGFTAVMGSIGGKMLQAISGWPLPVCLILVTGMTALLTFSGGVRATIATEGLQFALFSITIPALLLIAAAKHPESISDIAIKAATLTEQSVASMSPLQLFAIAVSFMLGETLLPPYANRALAARSNADSRSGFVMAGLYSVVWLGLVTALGVVAHGILSPDAGSDNVLLLMGQYLLPAGIFGLLLAAIVAIVMSSQEAVLNSATVAFIRDIVCVLYKPSDRTTLLIAKAGTVLFAAIAVVAAQFAPSVIDGLLILYAIWTPTILVPLVMGLFLRETRSMAGWLSIVAGGATTAAWQFLLAEPFGTPPILVGIAASLIGYGIGHFMGKVALASEGAAA
ncbi:MAG: sodium:solute symporter family protein [Magnetospirillum gryphiswaldense]|nr:sodium:solute symporter family protein [Magnetospirillum gryphiswaldense]